MRLIITTLFMVLFTLPCLGDPAHVNKLYKEKSLFFDYLKVIENKELIDALLTRPDVAESFRKGHQNKIDFVVNTFFERADIADKNNLWRRWFRLGVSSSETGLASMYAVVTMLLESPERSVEVMVSESGYHKRFGMTLADAVAWIAFEYIDYELRMTELLNSKEAADRYRAYQFLQAGPSSRLRIAWLENFWPRVLPAYRPLVMADLLSSDIFLWEKPAENFLMDQLSKTRWQRHPDLIIKFVKKYAHRPGFAEDFVDVFLKKPQWRDTRIPLWGSANGILKLNGPYFPSNNPIFIEQLMHLSADMHKEILKQIIVEPSHAKYLYLIETSLLIDPRLQAPDADRKTDRDEARAVRRNHAIKIAEAQALVLSQLHTRLNPNWTKWMRLFLAKNPPQSALSIIARSGVLRSPEFLKNSSIMTEALYNNEYVDERTRKLWDKRNLNLRTFEFPGIFGNTLSCPVLFAK